MPGGPAILNPWAHQIQNHHGPAGQEDTPVSPGCLPSVRSGLPGKGTFCCLAAPEGVIPLLSPHFPSFWGERMDISSSPCPPKGENPSFCIYYPSLELFIQINLWVEAKPWVIPWKTRKFSEPNGSNYRGLGSELSLKSDMSGR